METITISLEEYKELLEIKGKYEETKKHPIIQYVYVYDTKPWIDVTPKITWEGNNERYFNKINIS